MHTSLLTLSFTLILPLISASGFTAPAWSNAHRNESGLYGYQLVGSGFGYKNYSSACDDISSLDGRRWLMVNLEDQFIQRAYCDQVGWNWNSSTFDIILQNVEFYNTGLFLTWLLNAFDTEIYLPNATANTLTPNGRDTNPFIHLCAALKPSLLTSFNLNPTRILTAICAASNGTTVTAPPESPSNNQTNPILLAQGLSENVQIRSTLLAYVLITTSNTYAASDALCLSGYDFIAPLESQNLDGHNVSSLLCGPEGRRQSGTELAHKMNLWRTKLFVNLVENVNDEYTWKAWLCANLDADALRVMGLDGVRAKQAVCWISNHGEGLWGYCGRSPLDDECGQTVDGDWART